MPPHRERWITLEDADRLSTVAFALSLVWPALAVVFVFQLRQPPLSSRIVDIIAFDAVGLAAAIAAIATARRVRHGRRSRHHLALAAEIIGWTDVALSAGSFLVASVLVLVWASNETL